MAWAIITIYISKYAQMNPQQLPKTSKFYSICKWNIIEKTLVGVGTIPLGSPKVNRLRVVIIVTEVLVQGSYSLEEGVIFIGRGWVYRFTTRNTKQGL